MKYVILTGLIVLGCSNADTHAPKMSDKIAEISESPADMSAELFSKDRGSPDSLVQILPIDQRKEDLALDAFLDTFEEVIAGRDLEKLMSLMNANICSSYGGGMYGDTDFVLTWQNDWHRLWEQLDRVVTLGGFFYRENGKCQFRMPYVHNERLFSEVTGDCFSLGAVTERSTVFFKGPDSTSARLDTLSYTAFEVISHADAGGFMGIKPFHGNKEGFVAEKDVYLMSDYMLVLEPGADKKWKITSFAPCD